MNEEAEPFREVVTNHIDAIRKIGSKLPYRSKRVSDAKFVHVQGQGPHKNRQYDPSGHITLNFGMRDYKRSSFAGIHIEDVDIILFFLSYLLK